MSIVNVNRKTSSEFADAINAFLEAGGKASIVKAQKRLPRSLRYNPGHDVRCRNKGEFGHREFKLGF